jgi:L-seryl-tRNA(Ser) seleniumtransferase
VADDDVRRRVPRTDTVLADQRLAEARQRLDPRVVKAAVRSAQQAARDGHIEPDDVVAAALANLPGFASTLRRVINATGVIVHTNLGRAPLSAAAVDAVVAAGGYTDVELDLRTGQRGRRGRAAMAALAEAVPAAEAVHVVNNGAAALVLAATALAAGREIVVSRGELVEIGDGFRLPELLETTGARICEVGTTNRTTLHDYRVAIGPQTGFVLKVHPSNFVVTGFTSSVAIKDLGTLDVPVVVDIGSGLLARHHLLVDEPDAASALQAGAALVTASGDKLLGGPQAGLLLGRRDIVEALRRHPLARALRVDKLTLAALEATLRGRTTPVETAIDALPGEIEHRAQCMAAALEREGVPAQARPTEAAVGGGGAPGHRLSSFAVAVNSELAAPLRTGDPAIVGRVADARLFLDLRCVDPVDDERVQAAVLRAATS